MLFTRAYATRSLLTEVSGSGLAVLRTDEPRLLLEAADVVVENVGGGGILGVNLLVDLTHGADGRVDGGDGEFLGVIGLDDRLGDGREGVALGDDLGQATSVRTFCRLPARTSEALKPVDSTVMMNLLYVSFRCGVSPCGAVPFRHIHDGPLVPQFLALSTV